MFTIQVQTVESVTVVIPEGRLDTVNSALFNEKLNPLSEKEEYLVIDLSKCEYLASSGIRSFMAASKKLAARGGSLLLSGLQAEVFHVIEMTGLHQVFLITGTKEEAIRKVQESNRESKTEQEFQTGNHLFKFNLIEKDARPALIWKNEGIVGYNELAFAAGIGSPAETSTEEEISEGEFVTLGNCSGFIPFNEDIAPDFRVVNNPAAGGIFITRAVSFNQGPVARVAASESVEIQLADLTEEVFNLPVISGTDGLKALLVADHHPDHPSLSMYLLTDPLKNSLLKTGFPDLQASLSKDNQVLPEALGIRFLLNSLPAYQPDNSLHSFLNRVLVLENIEEIMRIDLASLVTDPVVWLFLSSGVKDAVSSRVKVEATDQFVFEAPKAFLTRRLYSDSSRVVVKQLHGGYSAQTFQVESYDFAGRKLRPTVLKIANRAIITREAERCKKYSLPFILNNSAMVLGTEFYGDTGALRYNFVGIGGEQTQLKWLTHYFNTWPVSDLEPLFDKIFLQILKPWYGQPVREDIHPFRDHDPTLTFFTKLCEVAEEVLNISPEDQLMIIPETGEKRMNPYWFLKHEYARRREEAMPYLTSVCHGDLNMQNILLDKEMNVYLIDFSETKPRAVVSDFARLEAIFMVEHAQFPESGDLTDLVTFTNEFYQPGRLDQLPEVKWTGINKEKMDRNIALTRKMREYAMGSSEGDTNLIPYCMAMLEWVLPIVCYWGVPLPVKKLSAYVSGILCEKVAYG